ncbi:MAG: ATP-binding protein [Aphanocapsa feldmannii 277cV]|uniref:ATP-binding protein n=1 Tax=Aphanocapsa feldmannii 277cV TaxID=2507553 RepID=A0A524RME3_9CHRO|nr:MAG: ATP-binding protein [Aphanocapsa feldmannii 277cV]
MLALAVRRSPNLVKSDDSSRKLIKQFLCDIKENSPADGTEYRLGLVVSDKQKHQKHAEQLAQLADLARNQMDAPGFFELIHTPDKFDSGVRERLNQLEKLVEQGLDVDDLSVIKTGATLPRERTWQLLSRLTVLMPRLESPDDKDWSEVVNNLKSVARDSDLSTASRLRDRLVALASDYLPNAARVDLAMLRRDSHALLDLSVRRNQHGWRILDTMDQSTRESVRVEIASGEGDRRRSVTLDRHARAMELMQRVSRSKAVMVVGESGVGKSALAVSGLSAVADTEPDQFQAICFNLRHIPKLPIEFQEKLGDRLSALLAELSAPQRLLIIDGADAVTEDSQDAFRYLVAAAQDSDVKVVAVASIDSKQVVSDDLNNYFDNDVLEYVVPPLSDLEIHEITRTFSELKPLNANPRSRELLRRLVVVDLLVRGGISGVPLTDVDAMNEVWSRLVRRRGKSDRGSPDKRELALLKLAELDLGKGERLDVINGIDSAALDGLRRDGLLRPPLEDPFKIGPEFSHEEVRRYAVARLLLSARDGPASRLTQTGAPRWSLAAARLACQAWLTCQPDTTAPLSKDRLGVLQRSFDALVESGHESRWGDVPGEALLKLSDPKALLRNAWPGLLADNGRGLQRLARLVDQHHRDCNNIVDVAVVEPIIEILLKELVPWKSGKHAKDLLRDLLNLLREWLKGHAMKKTIAGHPLRILLRQDLVEAWRAGERHLSKECNAQTAARDEGIPEKAEHEHQLTVGELLREFKDEIVLVLLALLGSDLGDDGVAILRKVAKDEPWQLGPMVDDPHQSLVSLALINVERENIGRGLLAELTEAYYLDDNIDVTSLHWLEDWGVRPHGPRGPTEPRAAWFYGPFIWLFRSDFCNGVRVLNRLLNHAAWVHAHKRTQGDRSFEAGTIGSFVSELKITGTCRLYVGDCDVWCWYRGTGVGPHPCFSALQALEHVCDERIKAGIPIANIVPILLDGCESLAMVGLIVGLLVRHLESADDLLDPYLAEPIIWVQEFHRTVLKEKTGLAASSDGLVAPHRRGWSFHEVSIHMVINADGNRASELRALSETLVVNARRLADRMRANEPVQKEFVAGFNEQDMVAQVRAWASYLDPDRYRLCKTEGGWLVEIRSPDDVVEALGELNEDLDRTSEEKRLLNRYFVNRSKEDITAIGVDELIADIATARRLLDNPPSYSIHPRDTYALVAAVALEKYVVEGAGIPHDQLLFAAQFLLQIGEDPVKSPQDEIEEMLFEQGADRSAARALPLLLLPAAVELRTMLEEEDATTTLERIAGAAVNLAQAVANEVRLYLARSLDHVWRTPCVEHGCCHHELGWRIITATLSRCIVVGNPETGRYSLLGLNEPIAESLNSAADHSIRVSQLDAAIRALASAGMANVCVSEQARVTLSALLAAQRRSLLACPDEDPDFQGCHTLVSARALLTLARDADDEAIYEHIDAYADHSALLDHLLHSLSAAGEETCERAATVRRLWPRLIRKVLQLNESGHTPFQGGDYGDLALGSLIPNLTGEFYYLYREVHGSPIKWWNPNELESEVEAWLMHVPGNRNFADRLIDFIRELNPEEQACLGVPWVAKVVGVDRNRVVHPTSKLENWLIGMRDPAVDARVLPVWQKVVDVLVVAGSSRLAPYSD